MYGHAEHPTLLAYVSDWVTALCYYAIPAQLLYFLAYFPYQIPTRYKFAVLLAGAFIGLCGSSHLCMTLIQDGQLTNQSVLDYMKLFTAIVSALTACVLLILIPEGLRFVNYSLDLEQSMKRKLIELDDANRTVRAANMNKGLFISTLSHELRNPLHVITANADFLMESQLTEDQREYVRCVTDSAQLMTNIVNDVLDMSRLQAGRMSFERIPVDLNTVASQCIKNMRHTAKSKKIDLTLEFQSINQFVISDPTRLHQLMLNLLTNALKFTASGKSVSLKITNLSVWPINQSVIQSVKPLVNQSLISRRTSQTEDDDLTDATLRLLRINDSLSEDVELEGAHTILPCLSDSPHFTENARSIWLDYTSQSASPSVNFVDDLDPDGKHLNEHKFIHSAEEDIYSDEFTQSSNQSSNPESDSDQSVNQSNHQRRSTAIFAITVTDSGVGISSQSLGQLFHAYTQAKLSTVREHGGSGLGLSICSAIVCSLNGAIIVTSELGKGSEFTFIIRLPLSNESEWTHLNELSISAHAQLNEPLSPPKTSQALSPAQHLSTIKSAPAVCESQSINQSLSPSITQPMHTILVTDDNEVNRKILSRILMSMKYNVVTANDGLEAVEAFTNAKQPFLCAFLDLCMPRMDGFEATRHIRSMGYTTPIIALTANALIEERAKSVEAGMNEFCTKPLRKIDVAKVLYRVERDAKLANAQALIANNQSINQSNNQSVRPPPIDSSAPLYSPQQVTRSRHSPSVAETDSSVTSSFSSISIQVESDSPFRGNSSAFLSKPNSPPPPHHFIEIDT